MPRLIALDTEVVIIAAGGHTPIHRGQERVLQLIDDHKGAGDDIYIPAPVIAECCSRVGDEVLARLRVWSFNAVAAELANRLIAPVRGEAELDRYRVTREQLKVDAMILATAEVRKAHILYVGEDEWFKKTADRMGLRVEIREIPELRPVQLEMTS